jgi:hypothetical protein
MTAASRSYYGGPMMVTLPATRHSPATEVHEWRVHDALKARACSICAPKRLAVCRH